MKHNQKQRLQDLAQSTVAHLEHFGQTLQGVLEQAPERLEQIRETMGPAVDKLHETLQYVESAVESKSEETREQASRWADVAQRKSKAVQKVLSEPGQTKQTDHDSAKFVWLLMGLGAGALLGLFLAPSSGRRSRASVRDQLNRNRKNLTRATTNHAADFSNKAKGLTHKIQKTIQHKNDDEAETNEILADRVRTTLGKNPDTSLPHLNIQCSNGVVTLYGPTVDVIQEAALINAVQDIHGVVNVQSKLPVSSE
ncbi:MAG: BON domain-containing protein [Abditibacteriaceae bacterium]